MRSAHTLRKASVSYKETRPFYLQFIIFPFYCYFIAYIIVTLELICSSPELMGTTEEYSIPGLVYRYR